MPIKLRAWTHEMYLFVIPEVLVLVYFVAFYECVKTWLSDNYLATVNSSRLLNIHVISII